MRASVLFPLLLLGLVCRAQTGPGGVGMAGNNVLWLSADQGVSTTGALVNSWTDRSGNTNHAAFQAGQPGERPALVTGSVNGYPSIDFDGVDDQLFIPDHNTLDLGQWDIFLVGAMDAAKNNNVWFSKGPAATTNVGFWSQATGALQMPIYDIFGLISSPVSPAALTTGSFSLIEYSNTAILGLFPSRNLYAQGASVYTDASLLQLPQTNNQPLRLGNVQGAAGWNLDGDLAELILYNAPLNQAQRIIVSNYLSAKYVLPHTTGNLYVQDDPANGDHDHDVAGIGRVGFTAQHTDARGSGLVRIYGATGLGNNEFMLWGHQGGAIGTWGSTDFPPGMQGRWYRVWRVSEVNQSGVPVDVGAVTMDFDLTGIAPITTSDIRLLVDTDNDGFFIDETPIGPPVAAGGNIYRFTNITALANGRRFTLGTINYQQTPLPVELLEFDAIGRPPLGVELTWRTATERNNDHFVVERSMDLAEWTPIATVPGAGSSTVEHGYNAFDLAPREGVNYYRLQQVDQDGSSTTSEVRGVEWTMEAPLTLFPVPAQNELVVVGERLDLASVVVVGPTGASLKVPVRPVRGGAQLNVDRLPAGLYLLRVQQAGDVRVARFIVSR